MVKRATSFTMRQIAANGKIRSLATRVFYRALCGDISKFYELYRWDGWREDMRKFSLDKVMFALPPILWQDADVRLRLKDMKKTALMSMNILLLCLKVRNRIFVNFYYFYKF